MRPYVRASLAQPAKAAGVRSDPAEPKLGQQRYLGPT